MGRSWTSWASWASWGTGEQVARWWPGGLSKPELEAEASGKSASLWVEFTSLTGPYR
jgi:hypothetical protein